MMEKEWIKGKEGRNLQFKRLEIITNKLKLLILLLHNGF